MELRHHTLGRDDQDALALAAVDELAEQDADLDGLPESDGVGNEDALPGLLESKQGRLQLVG